MNYRELFACVEKSPVSVRMHMPIQGTLKAEETITALVSDSRKVEPGVLFACVRGEHFDGHTFAAEAMEKGAVALLCERILDVPLPQLICSDVRRNMGLVAAELYKHPAEQLTMIALTGTNGKTTSAFMVKSILERAGIKTGLLGTVVYDDGAVTEDADHTTPEASDLQYWLHRMVRNGCKACVMEASSHAIDQGRIDGVTFDRAGFTNLTVEHLDYHQSMDNYFQAKRKLFKSYMRGNWNACICVDDGYGMCLHDEFAKKSESYSLKYNTADFFAAIKSSSIEGQEIEVSFPGASAKKCFVLPMIGDYNVLNALQAISLAWTLGVSVDKCLEGLTHMPQVPGRLERYFIEGVGTVVVDFAHSPDALEKVLRALRPVCKGRLIVAFGAGGDRDRTKRPIMGAAAASLADYSIITSDNPRSEDPAAIVREIEVGTKRFGRPYEIIVDRRDAIYSGLDMLEPDDIFVIAGKGPEPYQILKDGPIPFLDKGVVYDWCREHGKKVRE